MGIFDEALGNRSYRHPETPEQFKYRCNDYLKSIKVAIDKKAHGSQAEEGYFMEKVEALKKYFLSTDVSVKKRTYYSSTIVGEK